jgi:hypothetical protein
MHLSLIPLLLILIPQTGTYYLILLIPLLFAATAHARRERGITWIACAIAWIIPWVLLPFSENVRQWEALIVPLVVGGLWAFAVRRNYSRTIGVQ